MILCVSIVGNPSFLCHQTLDSFHRLVSSLRNGFPIVNNFNSLCLKLCRFWNELKGKYFQITSVRSVVIPRSVEVLSESCFLECKLLSSVTIESGSKNVTN
jgi:hypothetical protein